MNKINTKISGLGAVWGKDGESAVRTRSNIHQLTVKAGWLLNLKVRRELISNSLDLIKGEEVYFEGELQNSKYRAKDGTDRWFQYVWVTNVLVGEELRLKRTELLREQLEVEIAERSAMLAKLK